MKQKQSARLNFRLTPELKRTIELAAAHSGQSVSDFAISTLTQAARELVREQEVTRLSDRDRDIFLALIEGAPAKPNAALAAAAKRYKKRVR